MFKGDQLGKMKFITFLLILHCGIFMFDFNIDPVLQKNTLKFGYGIDYKYEGKLSQSIDSFYVVR